MEGNITLTSVSTKNLYVTSIKWVTWQRSITNSIKQGHACKSTHFKSTHNIGTDTDKEAEDCVHTMFTILSSKQDPIQIIVEVDNYPLTMKLDTGASLSIISETVYKNLPSAPKLEPTSAHLTMYTGESIKLLGSISLNVCHSGQEKSLPLLVENIEWPSLQVGTSCTWIGHQFSTYNERQS